GGSSIDRLSLPPSPLVLATSLFGTLHEVTRFTSNLGNVRWWLISLPRPTIGAPPAPTPLLGTSAHRPRASADQAGGDQQGEAGRAGRRGLARRLAAAAVVVARVRSPRPLGGRPACSAIGLGRRSVDDNRDGGRSGQVAGGIASTRHQP